jgi:hypothetical protein
MLVTSMVLPNVERPQESSQRGLARAREAYRRCEELPNQLQSLLYRHYPQAAPGETQSFSRGGSGIGNTAHPSAQLQIEPHLCKHHIDQVVTSISEEADPNMENVSCEEALDCLFAIYKVRLLPQPTPLLFSRLLTVYVSQKTFVANVTTQVIERYIVRSLEGIFSPIVVNAISDTEVETVNRYGDIRYIKSINGISVCPSGIPTVKRFFGIWIRQWSLQEAVYIYAFCSCRVG